MKSYKRKYKRYAEDSVVCLQDTDATTSRAIESDIASDFLSILTNETITEFLKNTGKNQKKKSTR